MCSWGWNLNGQLGNYTEDIEEEEAETIVPIPSSIDILNEKNLFAKFVKISLGSRHSAILEESGNLYTFGWNKYKQCYHEEENILSPEIVEKYRNRVLDVKCGPWYTLILIKK